MLDQRMRVMTPEKAKSLDDVDAKVTAWKADMRILRESRQKQDIEMMSNNDQMITILLGMVPEALSDHLVVKYVPGETVFEDMLNMMQDHLLKLDQKKASRKFIDVAARGFLD